MSTDRTFFVHYSRDDNDTWLAEVFRNPDVGERVGVASHGRTLQSAEANVREALALFLDIDDEQSLTLLPRHELGRDIEVAIANVSSKRDAARQEEADAIKATADVARTLVNKLGLSLRDAGQLLGFSHQRIQQLLLPGPGLDLKPELREAVDMRRLG